jgi:DNA (cytosine-5)-methyltransferase 1
LFVVCVRNDVDIAGLTVPKPSHAFHGKKLQKFLGSASRPVRSNWLWWKLDDAPAADHVLDNVLEKRTSMPWFSDADTDRLLTLMSPPSLERLRVARKAGRTVVGTIYKRGRPDADGNVRQRAELRTDGLAGCLRTPAGGSSRQILMFIKGNRTRARLVSSREVARLMGLHDSYRMPDTYNNAYRVAGDGVAVPVVRYLDQVLFTPILARRSLEAVA